MAMTLSNEISGVENYINTGLLQDNEKSVLNYLEMLHQK